MKDTEHFMFSDGLPAVTEAPVTGIDELVSALAEARKKYEFFKAERMMMLEYVTKSDMYLEVEGFEEDAKKHSAQLEEQLRTRAIEQLYKETKEKKFPGVSIRVMQKMKYDSGVALTWCWDNLKKAVSLNKTEFEKLAKNAEGLDGLNFVERYEEPSAAIDSDLSGFLEG